ncbi:MAG TPA: PqqD family protein [Acidobacteriota bacterium]|nr:PqqD family protein [Acidobacteriota bacterium]
MVSGKRWGHNGEFVFRRVGGEAVLVPIRGGVGELGSIFTLNEVGATIWHLIDPRRDLDDIARSISQEFDVSEEKAREDANEFLTLLESRRLIRSYPEKAHHNESSEGFNLR